MLFFRLPQAARTAFLVFIALPVTLITFVTGPGAQPNTGHQDAAIVTGRGTTATTTGPQYWLMVRTTDGHQDTHQVTADGYRNCTDGAAYPACANR